MVFKEICEGLKFYKSTQIDLYFSHVFIYDETQTFEVMRNHREVLKGKHFKAKVFQTYSW